MENKQTAKEFLLDYIQNSPENRNDKTGLPYYRNLTEFFNEVGYDYDHYEEKGDSRWWSNGFAVQEINGKLIGYEWATTTGDDSPTDKGWQFNENSICFVEKKQKTIDYYEKIKEEEKSIPSIAAKV